MFFYVSNTDNSNGSTGTLSNRIVGSAVQTTPGADGRLQVLDEQPLGDGVPGVEGHPASLENPFNGEILTAFDHGNGTPNGDLSYYRMGTGPTYQLTSAREEYRYLSGTAGTPFKHQHPQLAADPVSGVIALGHQAFDSEIGLPAAYVVTLLGPEGAPLSSQLDLPLFVADSVANIGTSPNAHVIRYAPASGSFMIAFNAGGITSLAALQVTSSHRGGGEIPKLSISAEGANVVLSWPASANSAVLESADRLNPATWTAAGGTVVEEGAVKKVVLTPGSTPAFFRLNQP